MPTPHAAVSVPAPTLEQPRTRSTELHPSHQGEDELSCCGKCCILIFLGSVLSLLLYSFIISSKSENLDPIVRVESVSASVEELKWVIGFSVRNPNQNTGINYYKQIDVSFQGATQLSTIPPFKQGRSKTARFNSTMDAVNAPWPDHNSTMLNSVSMVTIRFRTSFDHTDFPLVEGRWVSPYTIFECEDVTILFQPNATKGFMFGDPLDCYNVAVVQSSS